MFLASAAYPGRRCAFPKTAAKPRGLDGRFQPYWTDAWLSWRSAPFGPVEAANRSPRVRQRRQLFVQQLDHAGLLTCSRQLPPPQPTGAPAAPPKNLAAVSETTERKLRSMHLEKKKGTYVYAYIYIYICIYVYIYVYRVLSTWSCQ